MSFLTKKQSTRPHDAVNSDFPSGQLAVLGETSRPSLVMTVKSQREAAVLTVFCSAGPSRRANRLNIDIALRLETCHEFPNRY